MLSDVRIRWSAAGGYRDFLALAFPLILSTASWSIQNFVDRVFLAWHSTESMAAALPAGMSIFVFVSFFLGLAGYVNTFVAQYVGARRYERVAAAIWQGTYLSFGAGVLALGLLPAALPLFDLIGHEPAIRQQEIVYFRILCFGTGPFVLSTALSCFFSGRGKTWTVLIVNSSATCINIGLDYGLIFGHWGFPAMGIRGAAWATNFAALFSALLFALLILQRPNRKEFGTLSQWRFDRDLFGRLLRFGVPSGINFMLDIIAFSFFILIVGRLGTIELAATNMAFNVNGLAFMPLIGCGIAVSTLVGQRLGENQPEAAEYCTWSGMHLALGYMGVMAVLYLAIPQAFLMPYGLRAEDEDFLAAQCLAAELLRIVAIYCVFDGMYIVFTSALKGAGDTRYVMIGTVGLSWLVMLVPSVVGLALFDFGIWSLWAFLCAYIVAAGIVFYFRFKAGKWKTMRVIEENVLPETVGRSD